MDNQDNKKDDEKQPGRRDSIKKSEETLLRDDTADTNKQPETTSKDELRYVIKLEGSHLGATDTDSDKLKERKHVKFVDQKNSNWLDSEDEPTTSKAPDAEKSFDTVKVITEVISDIVPSEDDATETTSQAVPEQKITNSEEITERFNQIMAMFDNFTRGLDPPESPRRKRSSVSIEDLPRVHKSRSEDERSEDIELERRCSRGSPSSRSDGEVSGTEKSCQTDNNFPIFLGEPVSEAESARSVTPSLVIDMSGKQALTPPIRHPLFCGRDSYTMPPPCERTFHTIHIAPPVPPIARPNRHPSALRRFWNVMGDICSALCLCLQVNKDCIFCLGFFVAFVVSASFLTAFFYRTLSMNPQAAHARLMATETMQQSTIRINGYYYFLNPQGID